MVQKLSKHGTIQTIFSQCLIGFAAVFLGCPAEVVCALPSHYQIVAAQDLPQAIADFANDLSSRLVAEKGESASFAISPTSIVAALGMALKIVHPEKKREFLEAIGLWWMTENEAHQAIGAALRAMALPEDFEQGTMEVAQGFMRKPKILVAKALSNLLQENYDAELIVSENLMNEVNQWVNRKTHGKIPTILSDNRSDAVLLNAIYLAFQWKDPFLKPQGGWKVENFTFANGESAPVSMMKQTIKAPIYRGDRFDLLEVPYESPEGRSLSQLIILPHDPKDLSEIEKGLTAKALQSFRKQAMKQEVRLSMPKIKMESSFSLLELLQEMGLPLDQLDETLFFSEEMKVSGVLHKIFVSTDEKGTEAAAVTAVTVRCTCMPMQPIEFKMDHSYCYFLMEGDTALFRGRVADGSPLLVD